MAEIKLRQLNKEYILNRIADIKQLEADIAEMEDILGSERKISAVIASELKEVIKKYRKPRRTLLYYAEEGEEEETVEDIPDYAVTVFLSKEGYFKKITPQSLRMSGEHKLKDGDVMETAVETTNRSELLFFSDRCQVYKARTSDFDDTKASVLGDYIPAKLGFDSDEKVAAMVVTDDYSGYVIFVFENGKTARVPLSAYETKTNRKKLTGAYADKSPLVKMFTEAESTDVLITTDNGRALLFNTGMLLPKTTRNTIGVQVISLKKNAKVSNAYPVSEEMRPEYERFAVRSVPAAGFIARNLKDPDQLTLGE